MTGLLDPSKWNKPAKPLKMLTSEEQRELDKEIQELIDEALGGRAAKHLKGERQRNEAAIASYVDQLLADELLRISEPRLPSKKTRDKYMETWREFADWCRFNGVDPLPAAGPVMFCTGWSKTAPRKRFLSEFAR